MRKLVSVALTWMFLGVLTQPQASKKPEVPAGRFAEGGSSRGLQDDKFDWSGVSPVEFLDMLKTRLGPVPIFTVWTAPPPGWIKESDVEQLMGLIGSKEPAGHVVMAEWSQLPAKRSTVGVQAMFLIRGYRTGSYPPAYSSEGFKGNPAEYRKWWRKRATAPKPAS